MHIDFVIVTKNGNVGYLSTNMACPIWGYKQNSCLLDCLKSLRESFPDFTYTREGIIPNSPHSREFEPTDKIYANKVSNRLDKVCNIKNKMKINKGNER